jgi:MarR family transcriptional regulator, lower aerobic nicotinate degradation pathway regulator
VDRTISDSTPGTTTNVGFLLAKASQRFNELLVQRFAERGFPEVRASYGSVLVPVFERDGLRLGELASASRLSKQAITGLVKLCEDDGLVVRERDADDRRAFRVSLSAHGRRFQAVAEEVLRELDEELVRSLGTRNHDALVEALNGVIDL